MPFETTIEIPTLIRAGDVNPSSYDSETRTFEVVWSTGFKGKRRGWFRDDWWEELSMDPKHVRLGRLNSGAAPFLDSHRQWGTSGVIGVIESARIEDGKGIARVRLSKREGVEDLARDIQDGILRNVSVGYSVHKFKRMKDLEGEDGLEVWRAVDWEPGEVSLVPIGFDPDAQVRSQEQDPRQQVTRCVFEGARGQDGGEGSTMPKENVVDDGEVETPPADDGERSAEGQYTEDDVKKAQDEARKRTMDVYRRCGALGLSNDDAQELLSRGLEGERLKDALLDLAEKRNGGTGEISTNIEVGRTEGEKTNEAIRTALEHRVGLVSDKDLTPEAREVRGMTLLRMGEEVLRRSGHKFTGFSPLDLSRDILGAQGTSAFPKILENIASKVLLKEYQAAAPTYAPIAAKSNARDFKEMARNRFSDLDELKLVNQHGEFERGTVAEEGEKYAVQTYGRIYALTRQAIIDDDTSAFDRIPRGVNAVVMRKRSDLVWKLLTANANMADGNALFSSAHANNLASSSLGIASLKEARKLLRAQKNIKGDHLNLPLATLIVPGSLQNEAEELIHPLSPNSTSDVNIFTDVIRQVIVESRLDGTPAADTWYVSAPMAQVDLLEWATLTEDGGPYLEAKEGFHVDGVEWKIRDDFGAAVLDYRGFVRGNP